MILDLDYRLNDIQVDFGKAPAWANKIQRWSQLDAQSYAVAESTFRHLDFFSDIDQFIILSSQGSFQTDYLFAHGAKLSPSSFVHTLPNIRSLAFSQISGREGVMFCFSQGKHSLIKFFNEAIIAHQTKVSLVLNLNKRGAFYECDFYRLGPVSHGPYCLEKLSGTQSDEFMLNDFQFRDQLASESRLKLSAGLIVRKNV